MPEIQFGLSSYERGQGDLPELPVVNMYAEEAPTEQKGVVLQSRPGLTNRAADMGAGPVQQLFQADLVLNSSLFGIANGQLYQGTLAIGSVDGAGPFSMAGYESFLFAAGGASLWGYDGGSLAAIAFPDSADVAKVIIAAERAVCLRKDTGKFYWTEPLGTSISALAFATAEEQPDRVLDCLYLDGQLVLFGAETTEFMSESGNDDLPFQAQEGRVLTRGVKATGCAVKIGPTFAWVTHLDEVCLGDESNVISNPGLQARIAASTHVSLFVFVLDGVEFLALRLDTETQVWCRRSQQWSEFQSYGKDNWIPQCYAGGVFGSSLGGATYAWGTGHSDDDVSGNVLERRFRGGFPIDAGGVDIANVNLRTNVGQTPFLVGDYTVPQVEMRLSRDAGQTWGNWRGTSLGEQGNYRQKVQWRRCGMASQPGFFAEFRVTAPVPFRVSDVLANVSYGGR